MMKFYEMPRYMERETSANMIALNSIIVSIIIIID